MDSFSSPAGYGGRSVERGLPAEHDVEEPARGYRSARSALHERESMFLKVTVTESEDLGFRVHPATFELDLLAMLEFAYERRQFCGYLKDVPGQDPPAEVLAAEWVPTIRALEELVAATGQDEVAAPPPGDWGLERCVDPLVAERKYRAVHCPACAKAYAAGAIVEEDFGYEGRVVGGAAVRVLRRTRPVRVRPVRHPRPRRQPPLGGGGRAGRVREDRICPPDDGRRAR